MELYKNKEWLSEQLKIKSVREIADELHCGEITIYRWIHRHQIPLKTIGLPYQDKKWLAEQIKHKTNMQIATECNVSEATITRWLCKFKMNARHKPYKDKKWFEEHLIKAHGNLQMMARMTGYCPDTLREWLHRFGFKSQYTHLTSSEVNNKYFQKINTERKAYFLGFLMADGCMSKDLTKLTMMLQAQDKYILEELLKDVKPNGKLYFRKGSEHKRDAYGINVSSAEFCKYLIYHGIIPKKTGKECLPDTVPKHLIRHFIRGFMDGDGCIGNPENAQRTIMFCSASLNILMSIKRYCENELHIKEYGFSQKSNGENILYYYSTYGDSTITILNHLYKDATIYLTRKYDRYKNISPALSKGRGNKYPKSEKILTHISEDNSVLNNQYESDLNV